MVINGKFRYMVTKELEIIKSAVSGISDVERCVLYGSRARGDAELKSDWDILVVVQGALSFNQKFEIEMQIRKAIAGQVIPVDVLVVSSEEAAAFREFPGSVIRHALKEGVSL
jgi:uncharacterized protein